MKDEGGSMRYWSVVAAVLALALAGAASAEEPDSRFQPELSQIASYVAQREVRVECGPLPESNAAGSGVAYLQENRIVLHPSVCASLEDRLRLPEGSYSVPLAASLQTLVHEGTHLRLQSRDESLVDCTAVHLLPGVASRFFGFRTWRLRHDLMAVVWQWRRQTPPELRRLC